MTEKYEPQIGDIVSITGTIKELSTNQTSAYLTVGDTVMHAWIEDLELVERPVKLPEIGSKWRHKILQEQRKLTVAAHFENYVVVQWSYRSFPSVLSVKYLYMHYEPI